MISYARSISSVPIVPQYRKETYDYVAKRICRKRKEMVLPLLCRGRKQRLVPEKNALNESKVELKSCSVRQWMIMKKKFVAKAENLTVGQLLDV